MVRKQKELANFLLIHNISLFRFLETKVKRAHLDRLYQNLSPGWCFTHNLAHHHVGRIILGDKGDEIDVNILFMITQLIHIEVKSLVGVSFLCSFIYSDSSAVIHNLIYVTAA